MSGIPDTTEERIALIAQGNLDSNGASRFMNTTFDASDYFQTLLDYSERQQLIDGLYKIFCQGALDLSTRKRCLRALRKAGGETGLLPTSYHVTFSLQKPDAMPNASGGYSDVWKVNGPGASVFALKVLRVTQQDDFHKIKKRFCKEVLVAKQVEHDNVLPIEGIQMNDDPKKLCILSEWMDYGNLHDYLKSNGVADRIELLLGVTRGLNYLHSFGVIHGDLKSSNILIDPSGNPRLTDFGLSSITRDGFSVHASTPNGRGSTRWRAPELLVLSIRPKDQGKVKSVRPTKKSDVYSFAMVVTEVFTGKSPFDSYSDEQVVLLLAKGIRPDKPNHKELTPKMWALTRKCWKQNPKKRPDVDRVLKKLESKDGMSSFIRGGC